jgi:hypothetical protein
MKIPERTFPNLSTLTSQEAAFLEIAMTYAGLRFHDEIEACRDRLKASHPGSRYETENHGELRDWQRRQRMARWFKAAAQARARQAEREEASAFVEAAE